MNKKISIVVVLMLLCAFEPAIKAGNSSSSMDQQLTTAELSDEEDEYNTFTLFTALPQDIQKLIMQYVWAAESSPKQFKKTLANWKYTQIVKTKLSETSRAECGKYGYNGTKIPIHFYRHKDKAPDICDVGCIIQDAQPVVVDIYPAMIFGYSYADSALPQDYIFLRRPVSSDLAAYMIHEAEIKKKQDYRSRGDLRDEIYACSLSVNGDVAVVWKDQKAHKCYATFSDVASIKESGVMDLDNNKIELSHKPNEEIKSALFNLNGSQLAVPFYNIYSDLFVDTISKKRDILEQREVTPSNTIFIDAPSKNKQLQPEQILKRLMIAKNFPLAKSE